MYDSIEVVTCNDERFHVTLNADEAINDEDCPKTYIFKRGGKVAKVGVEYAEDVVGYTNADLFVVAEYCFDHNAEGSLDFELVLITLGMAKRKEAL